MPDDVGLFEAIYTQRAIRYLKPDPVPDDLIRKVIDAGIRAPNGGNSQRWSFIVIKDRATKEWIAERYANVSRPSPHSPTSAAERRMIESTVHLGQHLAEVPVLILVCLKQEAPVSDLHHGASIYPAVQNMLLAARGLGLGSVLTTRPRRGFEREIKALLGIPDDVDTAALLPIGFPADGAAYGPTTRRPAEAAYGPTTRRPAEEVAFSERWGQPW